MAAFSQFANAEFLIYNEKAGVGVTIFYGKVSQLSPVKILAVDISPVVNQQI